MMRRTTWIRVGVGGVILGGVAGGGVLAVGCSSDDSNVVNTNPGPDASGDHTVPPPNDGGNGNDATNDASDAATGPQALAYLVHAAPDMPPLRFCFGLAGLPDGGSIVVTGGFHAAPDSVVAPFPIAGLFPGFGGPLNNDGFDLATINIDVFAIDATKIANNANDAGPDGGAEIPCEGLIGPDGQGNATDAGGTLTQGVDYWLLTTIPMGMLAHGTSWLAAVTGCLPTEPDASAALLCPNGQAGNLGLSSWQLDNATAVAGGSIGAQFVQASSPWDNEMPVLGGMATAAGFAIPNPAADAGDGSAPSTISVPISLDSPYGSIKPATLAAVPGVTYDGTSDFFVSSLTADGGTVAVVGYPLPLVQALTWPTTPPTGAALANGAGFAFVFVGDPLASPFIGPDGGPLAQDAGGQFNGLAPHVLAFPTANP